MIVTDITDYFMDEAIDMKYIYSDLFHKIIGSAFEVQNGVGPGRPEKTYQKLMAKEFELKKLQYRQQVSYEIVYKGIKAGARRLDFIVEEKVVIELNVGQRASKCDFEQIHEYLKMSGLKLGLLIVFSNQGVKVNRIANIY